MGNIKINKLTWIETAYGYYYAVSKRLIHILWYDEDYNDWEYRSFKKEPEIIRKIIRIEEDIEVERAEGFPDEIKAKEEAFMFIESNLTDEELSEDNVQLTRWIVENIDETIKKLKK